LQWRHAQGFQEGGGSKSKSSRLPSVAASVAG
jgi:hypothetical protein